MPVSLDASVALLSPPISQWTVTPSACASVLAISIDGARLPLSIPEIWLCGVPHKRPSSIWLKPALRLAAERRWPTKTGVFVSSFMPLSITKTAVRT